MRKLNHIFEATYVQLDEVVRIVNEHWEEINERPTTMQEKKSRIYWEKVHRSGRLLLYRAENDELVAFLSLIKVEKNVTIDVFFILPNYRDQGIGRDMLRVAERIAFNWSAEQISWLFYSKEDIEKQFPIFQQLGYVLHCPIDKKGFVLLEKKIV
jgi:GNAT superfamily N-acetyltransferase